MDQEILDLHRSRCCFTFSDDNALSYTWLEYRTHEIEEPNGCVLIDFWCPWYEYNKVLRQRV